MAGGEKYLVTVLDPQSADGAADMASADGPDRHLVAGIALSP